MEECIEITVIPVSGSSFANQIGIISLLCDHGFRPKLVLASSGGGVAAYTGLCGDWKSDGIRRVVHDLSSDLFLSSWWGKNTGKYFHSGVIGIFKESLYNNGSGRSELLHKYLSKVSLNSCEIWLGTYNKDLGSAEMMCNRSYKDSYVKSEDDIPSIPTKIRYLDCDIDNVAKSIAASACIPTIVPPIEIDGSKYYDGGLLYSSPFIPLCDYLPKCLKIIYISSFDMEKDKSDLADCRNIIKLGIGSIHETITGLLITDKTFAIQMVTNCSIMHNSTFDNIEEALAIYRQADQAVMEIYPTKEQKVDILNFTSEDVLRAIDVVRETASARIWWTS